MHGIVAGVLVDGVFLADWSIGRKKEREREPAPKGESKRGRPSQKEKGTIDIRAVPEETARAMGNRQQRADEGEGLLRGSQAGGPVHPLRYLLQNGCAVAALLSLLLFAAATSLSCLGSPLSYAGSTGRFNRTEVALECSKVERCCGSVSGNDATVAGSYALCAGLGSPVVCQSMLLQCGLAQSTRQNASLARSSGRGALLLFPVLAYGIALIVLVYLRPEEHKSGCFYVACLAMASLTHHSLVTASVPLPDELSCIAHSGGCLLSLTSCGFSAAVLAAVSSLLAAALSLRRICSACREVRYDLNEPEHLVGCLKSEEMIKSTSSLLAFALCFVAFFFIAIKDPGSASSVIEALDSVGSVAAG